MSAEKKTNLAEIKARARARAREKEVENNRVIKEQFGGFMAAFAKSSTTKDGKASEEATFQTNRPSQEVKEILRQVQERQRKTPKDKTRNQEIAEATKKLYEKPPVLLTP